MLSIRIHSPQSGMIRKGRFSAILSPIKLTGDILLHDDRGMFALAKAEDCRCYEDDDHRAAGVTSVEKVALYANRPWLADIKLIQQFAQDDKPLSGDIAFMVRKGKGWADITQRAALVKALCREQAVGVDPELVAVSKAALEHLDGIAPAPHAQHRALDLLTDTLGDLTADEPLQPHVERMASEMARVQMDRHAYGMLKHVDPEQLMKISGECGFFSHVPRIKHVGREHLIVNMLKADGYDKYRIYGCVQQGKAVFVEKYTDDYIGKVAPYQVHEFHKAENFYFIPLTIVKRYAVPVLLKRYRLGKLFAGQRELAEIIKQEIAELDPDSMAALSTKEMKVLLSKLADVTTESRGSAREQYLNSVLYLTAELNKRGEPVELPKQLKTEVQRLTGLVKKDTAYEKESALIRENQKKSEAQKPHKFEAAEWTYGNGHPRCILCGEEEPSSGMCQGHKPTQKADATKNGNASPLALANILQHVKPIILHEGYVKVNDDSDGFFHGDVQFNVVASTGDDAIVGDAKMHIAKAFPPHIADRMIFKSNSPTSGRHPMKDIKSVIVDFSGGKDSTAALIWAKKIYGASNVIALHALVDESIPGITEYSRKIVKAMGIKMVTVEAEQNFAKILHDKKKWPYFKGPWCQQELIFKPLNDWTLKNCDPKTTVKILGGRQSQRMRFSTRTQGQRPKGLENLETWAPCFNMDDPAVMKYIEDNGVQVWPGYNQGYVRTACWCCPGMSTQQAAAIKKYLPDKFKTVEAWEKEHGKFSGRVPEGRSISELAERGQAKLDKHLSGNKTEKAINDDVALYDLVLMPRGR